MRKMISMLLISTILSGLISCAKSIDYFKENLDETMTYEEIIETFGKPNEETGLNGELLIYHLNDGTQIKIVFNGSIDYILRVLHEDKSEEEIETLYWR